MEGDDQKSLPSIDDKTFRGEIEFKNVWFRYPNPSSQHRWVFKGLSLKMRASEATAVVGVSGCGKSTLISLVMRFYDPEFGQILIDGIDIKMYRVAELRQRMGLVMQEPILFNCSVKDNILYGKPNATNLEIEEAVSAADATSFIT